MPLSVKDLLVDCKDQAQSDLRVEIQQKLANERAVLLRNTGMRQVSEMAGWARFIGVEPMEYRFGTGLREDMGAGVLSVGTEPHFTNVDPHSEMAYWTFYPKLIMFGCQSIPAGGGDTVIADNRRVTEDIAVTETGRKIYDVGIRYIRNYFDRERPDPNPGLEHWDWQQAFDVEQFEHLVALCEARQWRIKTRADGSVQISYDEQGYEYDPRIGRNLFFTSMARLGRAFDNWPPFDQLPSAQRPYHLMYADGSEFSAQDLQTMDEIFARYSIPIHWRPGDIVVLDNITWTHARPPFVLEEGETRSIGVLVSTPVERRRINQFAGCV